MSRVDIPFVALLCCCQKQRSVLRVGMALNPLTLISVDVLDIIVLKIQIHKVRLNVRAERQGRGQSQLSAPQSPSPGCECF